MSSRKYDVIIIGAGIGGLTCGCYLAKAGMKVLIVEQHTQVGGYCTSFNRQGFTFNVLTSTLGNLGKNKALGLIMSELGIDKKLDFIKVDPSDIILTSVYSIPIYSDFNKTINKLQESFPKEAIKIKEFFDFIRNSDMINLYFKLRRKTLKELLDSYFLDIQLKSIFTMMLCRLGLHPKDIAAFTSVVHFREFIMDMGYHPKGGMQRLSDAFAGRFRDFGGEILLKSRVDKIIIKNKKAMGVNIKDIGRIESEFVVCACDPTMVFNELINRQYLTNDFMEEFNRLKTGVSGFILFLGLDKKAYIGTSPLSYIISYCNKSSIYDYDPTDIGYLNSKEISCPIHLVLPSRFDDTLAPYNKESMALTLFVPYMNEAFWQERKEEIANKLIVRASDVVSGLSKTIIVRNIVTPVSLKKYTSNKNGSTHGWAPLISQVGHFVVKQKSFIDKLFFVGQWVTLRSGESGLPVAAYTGKLGAKLILKERLNK